ncbi:hypothetical protein OF83DRAFT_1158298 [Amylostereum chailletii]|nr:hypothetical protein OF83DRAFT_1158298 [Amylostereum chailletii]
MGWRRPVCGTRARRSRAKPYTGRPGLQALHTTRGAATRSAPLPPPTPRASPYPALLATRRSRYVLRTRFDVPSDLKISRVRPRGERTPSRAQGKHDVNVDSRSTLVRGGSTRLQDVRRRGSATPLGGHPPRPSLPPRNARRACRRSAHDTQRTPNEPRVSRFRPLRRADRPACVGRTGVDVGGTSTSSVWSTRARRIPTEFHTF